MNPLPLLRALSPRAWGYIGFGLLSLAVWLLILAWGNSRYNAGVTDTDVKWQAASAELAKKAANSADAATRQEAPRIVNHAAQVAAEKERIDEAVADGRSPLDQLFPSR